MVAAELPPDTDDRDGVARGVFATLIGALELSRAVEGPELSDRILAAGAQAAKALRRSGEHTPAEGQP